MSALQITFFLSRWNTPIWVQKPTLSCWPCGATPTPENSTSYPYSKQTFRALKGDATWKGLSLILYSTSLYGISPSTTVLPWTYPLTFNFISNYISCTLLNLKSPSKWTLKTSIPRPELCSGPLKLVVTVPETCQSRKKGVELKIWGADNNCRWGHITKHHLREALHICKSEVLYAGNTVLNKDTKKQVHGNHINEGKKYDDTLNISRRTVSYSSKLVTRSNPLRRASFCVTEPWYSSIRSWS